MPQSSHVCAPLPEGWAAVKDRTTNEYFYVHHESKLKSKVHPNFDPVEALMKKSKMESEMLAHVKGATENIRGLFSSYPPAATPPPGNPRFLAQQVDGMGQKLDNVVNLLDSVVNFMVERQGTGAAPATEMQQQPLVLRSSLSPESHGGVAHQQLHASSWQQQHWQQQQPVYASSSSSAYPLRQSMSSQYMISPKQLSSPAVLDMRASTGAPAPMLDQLPARPLQHALRNSNERRISPSRIPCVGSIQNIQHVAARNRNRSISSWNNSLIDPSSSIEGVVGRSRLEGSISLSNNSLIDPLSSKYQSSPAVFGMRQYPLEDLSGLTSSMRRIEAFQHPLELKDFDNSLYRNSNDADLIRLYKLALTQDLGVTKQRDLIDQLVRSNIASETMRREMFDQFQAMMDQHEVLVNRLQGKYGSQGVLEAGYLSAPTNGLTASGYFNSDLKIHSLKHLSTFVQETREQLRHSTSSRDSANMRGSFASRSAEFVKDIRNSSNSAQVAHEELRPSLRGSFGERQLEVASQLNADDLIDHYLLEEGDKDTQGSSTRKLRVEDQISKNAKQELWQSLVGSHAPPMPLGWEIVRDPETGEFYFYHTATGVVQWDPPGITVASVEPHVQPNSSTKMPARLPEKPVEMTLKLDLDFSKAGQAASAQRVAFECSISQDLAKASGATPDQFEVVIEDFELVTTSSVIIDCVIHPDPEGPGPDPMSVATTLEKQAGDPQSPLRSGVLTRHLLALALPTLRPGSMQKLLATPSVTGTADRTRGPGGASDGPAEASEAMPMGWQGVQDPATGEFYYYNTTTGVVQWEPPGIVDINRRQSIDTVSSQAAQSRTSSSGSMQQGATNYSAFDGDRGYEEEQAGPPSIWGGGPLFERSNDALSFGPPQVEAGMQRSAPAPALLPRPHASQLPTYESEKGGDERDPLPMRGHQAPNNGYQYQPPPTYTEEDSGSDDERTPLPMRGYQRGNNSWEGERKVEGTALDGEERTAVEGAVEVSSFGEDEAVEEAVVVLSRGGSRAPKVQRSAVPPQKMQKPTEMQTATEQKLAPEATPPPKMQKEAAPPPKMQKPAGMQKPTENKIEDSNVENIGSEMDKAARVAAAKTEDCWSGAGASPGVEIWRVHNKRTANDTADFGLERVPKNEYRKFYRGDSYVLLYTYKEADSDALLYNVHFWIGSESSQDEYGVAAYKTVELDDLLGGKPVQYRECEGYESELWLSYFKPGGVCAGDIQLLAGGHNSGFRKVKPEEYTPRLLWVRKEGALMLSSEVTLGLASLNSGDCFILDSGTKLFIFRGDSSSPFEKNRVMAVAKALSDERSGKSKVTDGEIDEEFWKLLGASMGAAVPPPIDPSTRPTTSGATQVSKMELFSLDDNTLEFVKVADGPLKAAQIRDDDVMLLNTGGKVFVTVGDKAPVQEKAEAMFKAEAFIRKVGLPARTQICRVIAGQDVRDKDWLSCFAG